MSKSEITGIDASYYITKDLAKATEFYSGLFGVKPTTLIPNLVSEWEFSGGEAFGLYQPKDTSHWEPSGSVLFHVNDLQAAKKISVDLGAMIYGQDEDTPVCTMAFGADPEGNSFILHQSKR